MPAYLNALDLIFLIACAATVIGCLRGLYLIAAGRL